MTSVVTASDVQTSIKIKISKDDESHEQTPPPPVAASPDSNRKIMVDEFMKSRGHDEGSYNLYWYARMDLWSQAQHIVENKPSTLGSPLTVRGDTALHVAVCARSTTFVRECVKLMRSDDQLIRNSDGMLPVHMAALSGLHRMVQYLTSEHLLEKLADKDIELLFFMTISSNMFDVAAKLFKKCPDKLAIARDEHNLTALHMLARKPSEILDDNDAEGSTPTGLALFKMLWSKVISFENVMVLITEPSAVLYDAITSGNFVVGKWLLTQDLNKFITIKDQKNGRNLLQLLVLYRHFDDITDCIEFKNHENLLGEVDHEGNNVLHLAAHIQPLSGSRASMQMQRELAWFKKVEKSVPRQLRSVRNKKGKRPIEVFYDEHKQLSEEIKGAAKGIAESGMLVATLVATVAFAAALTTPGDKTNNAWFIVFILTNAVALFTSSASILSFLSNFTSSRFAESEFVTSLHPSLTFGPALLMISVAAMVVAFTAASFLIFDHTSKWVSYVVASMGVFPLLLFLLFQFSFFDDFIWSRYYRPKLE